MTTLIVIFLIAMSQGNAQQAAPFTGGTIIGVLRGEDGAFVEGASVFLMRTVTSSERVRKRDWYARSGAQGGFRFDGLPVGQYRVCAQVPSSEWLNPCEWGLKPPIVSISRFQRSASVTIGLKKGTVLPIRVDDPGLRLAQYEGKTVGAHLLLGVSSDNFVFRSASIVSQDSGGRNYGILIPIGSPVQVVVSSSFFQLSDALGIALPRMGSTSIPVIVPAGQNTVTVRLVVTGAGK